MIKKGMYYSYDYDAYGLFLALFLVKEVTKDRAKVFIYIGINVDGVGEVRFNTEEDMSLRSDFMKLAVKLTDPGQRRIVDLLFSSEDN